MSYSLYVNSLPPEITLEKLIIYFQSTKSGGGDVDSDASKLEGDKAVVVFEQKEYLDNVLLRKHEIDGYNLGISSKSFKPIPAPRKQPKFSTPTTKEKIKPSNEKAYLGEVRTVIVSGLWPDTATETLEMFFENPERSRGGDIEKLERCQPDIAHITFASTEVALNVLKQQDKLEVDGYLLQLKAKQPELILPLDMGKLYVENLDPKTTEDSLTNYIELITRQEVCDVQFGENKNVLITLNEKLGIVDYWSCIAASSLSASSA